MLLQLDGLILRAVARLLSQCCWLNQSLLTWTGNIRQNNLSLISQEWAEYRLGSIGLIFYSWSASVFPVPNYLAVAATIYFPSKMSYEVNRFRTDLDCKLSSVLIMKTNSYTNILEAVWYVLLNTFWLLLLYLSGSKVLKLQYHADTIRSCDLIRKHWPCCPLIMRTQCNVYLLYKGMKSIIQQPGIPVSTLKKHWQDSTQHYHKD